MTERLYYHDALVHEFNAVAIGFGADPTHVILDRTAFYPTSGGQPHDSGTLNGVTVSDVIDDGDRIVHVTAVPLAPGPVHGVIDAVRRRDYTQQHTAQHLLSALAGDRLRWDTVSVHFGDAHSTIEYRGALPTAAQLADLERWANDVVAEARPVFVTFEERTGAMAHGLRKASDRDGTLRIVTITNIDRSACGGTHVARTSEIGAILLLGMERVRSNSRISFVAGDRTLRHARQSDAILASIARQFGGAVGELEDLAAGRQREARMLRDQIVLLEREVTTARLQAWYAATAPGPDGIRRMTYSAAGDSADLLRALGQGVASLERANLLITNPAALTVMLAMSADSGLDAAALLKLALASTGGRGGGSARLAQGTVPDRESLTRIVGVLTSAS